MFGLFEKLLKTQDEMGPQDHLQAKRMMLYDGVLAIGMITLQGGVFLTGFMLAMGASNYEIGLLTTIALLAQFLQLPGLFFVQTLRKRRAITVACAGASRLLWIPIIAAPLLFVNRGGAFILVLLLISNGVGALAGPAWNSLFRDTIPDEDRARLLSKRLAWGTALGLTLTLAGGYFVDRWASLYPSQHLYGYSIVFAVGLMLGCAGLVSLGKLPEPTLKREDHGSMLSILLLPLKDRNFRQLIWFIGIWSFAVNMAVPFFIVYMLQRINLPMVWVTALTVVSQLANIAFLGIWARLADRFSNKSTLAVSGFLFLLGIVLWPFTTLPDRHLLTIPLVILIQVLSGLAIAGVNVASGNIGLKLSPMGKGHIYMTVFALAGALSGSIAPLVGGAMADVFAVRKLAVKIDWSAPAQELSVSAIHFSSLDFVFFTAFIVGLVALNRLGRLTEKGETSERQVLGELLQEMAVPLRTFSSTTGIRRLLYLPISVAVDFATDRDEDENPDDPSDNPPDAPAPENDYQI